MTRLARIVIPGVPHHVTQRGNRRERVFFGDHDYRTYLGMVRAAAEACGTAIWAYCLMPNHVHFILTPADADGLRGVMAETHKRYSARINLRHGWSGHLWQGRFHSVAMDERHLLAALRYVALNPVAAGLVERAEDWPWSSTRAHMAGRTDGVVAVEPGLERAGDFAAFLAQNEDQAATGALASGAGVGRPLGSAEWLAGLEADLGRRLRPARRGPKPRPWGAAIR